ncbi:MAG: 30S ribosomal protein S18 [Chlorobiaceae bacterium]|nr:30S ribosomal protein S18 [Chlorobiaceae bacterium]
MKQKFTPSHGAKGQGNKALGNALASKKKVSKNQVVFFDYRDERKLKRFINDQGKIIPRRITGLSAKEQNLLTHSVKWARFLAVIPYVADEYK